jgi:hypothetical protein
MKSLKLIAGIGVVITSTWAGMSSAGESQVPDLSPLLKLVLSSASSTIRPGEAARLSVRIVNVSKRPIAVSLNEIGRYVNYTFEADATDDDHDYGGSGGVIGDPLPGAPPPPLTVLAPGRASTEFKWRWHTPTTSFGPGRYHVSVDYCHFETVGTAAAEDPNGCVSSNEVVLLYAP